jgi:hypothetical protein
MTEWYTSQDPTLEVKWSDGGISFNDQCSITRPGWYLVAYPPNNNPISITRVRDWLPIRPIKQVRPIEDIPLFDEEEISGR